MMEIRIDKESTVPLYMQIFNNIRDMILSGPSRRIQASTDGNSRTGWV